MHGNGNYDVGMGKKTAHCKLTRLDDFADLCDPHEMGSEWNELSEYMNLKVSKDRDLIQFWLDNKSVLPKLYTVARQVLCVPASSAASERVFSTAAVGVFWRSAERTCHQEL